MNPVVQHLPDEFVGAITKSSFRFRIDAGHSSLGVGHEDRVGRAVGDALGQAKLVEQLFFDPLALGDVGKHGDGADNALVPAPDRRRADQYIVGAAVGSHYPSFCAHRGIATQRFLQGPRLQRHGVAVGIIGLAPEKVGAGFGLVRRFAQRQAAGGGVDQNRVALGVAHHDCFGRLLEDGFQQILLFGELCFGLLALGDIVGNDAELALQFVVIALGDNANVPPAPPKHGADPCGRNEKRRRQSDRICLSLTGLDGMAQPHDRDRQHQQNGKGDTGASPEGGGRKKPVRRY